MNTKPVLALTISLLAITTCLKCRGGLPQEVHKSQDIIVFQNVNLVPMTDEKIVKNQTVLVKGNRIIEIGPSETMAVPENSQRINGRGAYLMPGLADMHMHTRDDWNDWLSDWPVSPLLLYLANGVTTIRCFGPKGSSTDYVLTGEQESKGENSSARQYTLAESSSEEISATPKKWYANKRLKALILSSYTHSCLKMSLAGRFQPPKS